MAVINLRDFPDDLHRSLKIRAAETGTTVKALMIKFCQEGLEREKKGQRKKRV
jgi:plasmid stability protein